MNSLKILLMEFDNWELQNAVDFVSINSETDARIYYTYAEFRDTDSAQMIYLKRSSKYRELGKSELERVDSWERISKEEFSDAKRKIYKDYN